MHKYQSPLLLFAAVIEGFVSPSNISGIAKALLGFSVAAALLAFIVVRGHPAQSFATEQNV